VPLIEPAICAVIVTVPAETPYTRPFLVVETLAIEGFEEDHVIFEFVVRFCVSPLE
jgi:hypothetical protein